MDSRDGRGLAAIVLAGGDGVRLRLLARQVFGQDLPKQFFPVFGRETLLERTLQRVALVGPKCRTITVLNRAHERFYQPLDMDPANLLIQPANCGTAPAIVGALMRLSEAGHTGAVALFPSDHYVSEDADFMRQVERAFTAVDICPSLIVLIGITPEGPETGYGWIEAGVPRGTSGHVFQRIAPVRRFWEKPAPDLAATLFRRGCLWNAFVIVANIKMLRLLTARALPALHAAFARVRGLLGTTQEMAALEAVYATLPPVDFSERVLARFPAELSVLAVTGVKWSDLGEPARLLATVPDFRGHARWQDRLRCGALR